MLHAPTRVEFALPSHGVIGGIAPPVGNERLLERLRAAFGTDFSLLRAENGEPLVIAETHRDLDWLVLSPLCREVALRGVPELVREEDPLLLASMPVLLEDGTSGVALGAFVSRSVSAPELPRLARQLGVSEATARAWADRQSPVAPSLLVYWLKFASETFSGERRQVALEAEVEKLSFELSTTYEEISLIYRLTQNLKLSDAADELSLSALGWVMDVIPAQGMTVLLNRALVREEVAAQTASELISISLGDCPLSDDEFAQLVPAIRREIGTSPLVFNRQTTPDRFVGFPQIGQLIANPLAEGDRQFGWILAYNHLNGLEFGTVEASLLGSVATILGMHGGNTRLYRQQAELLAGVIRSLTSAIDAKDPYTRGHSDRVARVAVRLAQALGCGDGEVERLYFAGLLHDIGKIGIDDQVLRKPGRLTDEEFEHIKSHTVIGHKILQDMKNMDHVLPVVLHHHEAWDGSGYPHGLAGENIPYTARIVAVADAFDAMASDRPYRKGMPEEKLDAILMQGAGQQWDPDVIRAFFEVRDDIRRIFHQEPTAIDEVAMAGPRA